MSQPSLPRVKDHVQRNRGSWGALLGVLLAAIPSVPTMLAQHQGAKVQQSRTAALSEALHDANVVIGNMSVRYHEVTMALIAYKAGTEGPLSARRAAENLLPPEGQPTLEAWREPEKWGDQ